MPEPNDGTVAPPDAPQAFDLHLRVAEIMLAAAATAAGRSREEFTPLIDRGVVVVGHAPRPELGDLAFPCFALGKALGQSPARIAAELVPAAEAHLAGAAERGQLPRVARLQAAGPYLNLFFDPGALAAFVLERVSSGAPPYGAALPPTGRVTMVEYSAPNTNKPLHVGHVRNNLIGLSLCQVLAAAGEEVIPVNLVNDRGVHIAKSMVAYERWGAGRTPQDEGCKGDHFVGAFYVRFEQELQAERARLAAERGWDPGALDAEREQAIEEGATLMAAARECLRLWEEGDPDVRALWARMNGWVYEGFDATYRRLGCAFRKWYYESETYHLGRQLVAQGLARGIFEQQEDGSIWARLESHGLKDKILQRADGTSVYITQDLGTAVLKFADFGMQRSIYVVASEQALHFQMLFKLLELLEFPWARDCHHLSYGLVTLPHGMGKLKSREGRTVDADALLDELAAVARRKALAGGYVASSGSEVDSLAEIIGQGALKMYLLQVGAEKNIQFDPDTTIDFEGDTGPAVQYSHARICSIVRKGIASGALAVEDLVVAEPLDPFADLGTGAPVRAAGGAAPSAAPPDMVRRAVGLRPGTVDATLLTAPEEKALVLELARFPGVVRAAAAQLSPAPLATYLLDLTKVYARCYHHCPVLRADTGALLRARVHLGLATAATLRRGLALLGIQAPDAM